MTVIVVGQAAQDVLLRVDGLPEAGGSTALHEFRRQLGGKGANQAVALAQLGAPAALVAVLGCDEAGAAGVARLRDDGVDTRAVFRRGRTAVLVDLVDRPGSRRLFEQVPASQVLSAADVLAARDELAGEMVDTMSLQLQQPPDAVLAAARWGREAGALVVADGAPQRRVRRELLGLVQVLRMDATEAALVTGGSVDSVQQGTRAGGGLLDEGPRLVAIAIPGAGDLLVWPGGSHLLEYGDEPVRDRTGGGDPFVAGLITGLRNGDDPVAAGRRANGAAASTVQRYSGRPALDG